MLKIFSCRTVFITRHPTAQRDRQFRIFERAPLPVATSAQKSPWPPGKVERLGYFVVCIAPRYNPRLSTIRSKFFGSTRCLRREKCIIASLIFPHSPNGRSSGTHGRSSFLDGISRVTSSGAPSCVGTTAGAGFIGPRTGRSLNNFSPSNAFGRFANRQPRNET